MTLATAPRSVVRPPHLPTSRQGWATDAALLAVLVAITLSAAGGADPAGFAAVAALLPVAAATPLLVRWDLAARRLPNAIVAQTAVPVLGAAVLAAVITPGRGAASVLGGLAFAGVLLAPALLGGMGMGDVKLGAVLGVAGGVLGGAVVLAAVLVAFTLGGLVSAALLLTRRAGGRDSLAFGPFLLAGFWVAVALV